MLLPRRLGLADLKFFRDRAHAAEVEMTQKQAELLSRVTTAVLLTPLPILFFSQDFSILAYVLSNFIFWMSLFAKPHHFVTGYRLSLTAFVGSTFVLLWWDANPLSLFHPPPIVALVLGASCGLILGYCWVEEYYEALNSVAEDSRAATGKDQSQGYASRLVKYVTIFVLFLLFTRLLWPAWQV